MHSRCPHCGQVTEHNLPEGNVLICGHCDRPFHVAPAPPGAVTSAAAGLIRSGAAAPCPVCGQLVELREGQGTRTFVPHYAAGQRKICPHSGKPAVPVAAPAPAAPPVGGKDLSAYRTKDFIKVLSCTLGSEPRLEELTLEYLDKTDRVRLQIDALREILGPNFQMKPYPAALNRPHLAVWGGATACVVAAKHPQGGYQSLADDETRLVVEEIRRHGALFFQ
jgi:hypothetical protein